MQRPREEHRHFDRLAALYVEDRADLEQGNTLAPVFRIAARGVEQSCQQRRTERIERPGDGVEQRQFLGDAGKSQGLQLFAFVKNEVHALVETALCRPLTVDLFFSERDVIVVKAVRFGQDERL